MSLSVRALVVLLVPLHECAPAAYRTGVFTGSPCPGRQVVEFYRQMGFEADPEGIKGMFWYPKF